MESDANLNKGLTKKERRELRREEKMSAGQMAMTKQKLRRSVLLVVLVLSGLLVVGGLIFLVLKPKRQLSEDHSIEFASQGQEHIGVGESHNGYNSNPPTSGPHWIEPVRDGVYEKSQPDEGLVHSLEHGRIWISYKSSIPDSVKQKLRDIAKSQVRMVLTVRDTNEADIAVAAWQRLDSFNLGADGSFDENRVLDFIVRYRDKAPENGITLPANMSGKEY